MEKNELEKIRDELEKMLIARSEDKIDDGSSEEFCAGVSSGFYDASCIVYEYLSNLMQ